MIRTATRARRGTILPLIALTIVVLLGFVALSIDIGLMAMAKTQCQNAADCSALTGARVLTGDPTTNNNYAACEPATRLAAGKNKILSSFVNSSDPAVMAVNIGAYAYDPVAGQFFIRLPKGANDPYCLVRVNLQVNNNPTYFGRIFNISSFNTAAMATAAHRPRDVSLILDFSGSMRFASLLGVPYNGTRDNGSGTGSGSNNPESVFPKFGHYASSSAGLRSTADLTVGGHTYSPSNTTVADAANDTRPPVIADFWQHPPYTDPDIPAFHNTVTGTGPNIPDDASLDTDNLAGGDKPLRLGNNSSNNYARTVRDVTGGTATHAGFESNGYDSFYPTGTTFKGYTQGPRYWGKTFFAWPPDPRTTLDWRKKFFTATTGSIENTKLWDASGNWLTPTAGGYRVNYNAILAWIKSSPNPFPTRLHAGHITYYTRIPDTINTSAFPPANRDERFWKEYIDHVLGVQQTSSTAWSNINNRVGYGADYTWGTVQITAKPAGKYMDYQDNPKRPRTHFWFGPMTMVDFIGCYNLNRQWWPGTCHEAPLYACKLAVRGALTDVENNHPNDFMSLILFSVPRDSAADTGDRFNTVRVPMGKNYPLMQSSLWYPQATLNADGSNTGTEITPYDAANVDTPRASGGTCYSMGLMLAYNQFQFTQQSDTTLRKWVPPSTAIPEGLVGGMGRKGAQKMIIFMTDGAPNTRAAATFRSSATPKHYAVRYNPNNPSGSEYPTTSGTPDNDSAVRSEIYGIIDQLKADHSSGRRPFRLHTIGFGPVFDSTNPAQPDNLATLQNMQYRGNSQTNPNTPLDGFKIVTGSDNEVIQKLATAITTIMQGSIQIVLLE